ncbi:hypothetical protein AVEN_251910-1 [Araneus ventricosus]|uniref:Uncharacterized protein n=1 Tax=Araneus ventricosus TaxID=182803 RepID=A0A4Y2H1M3_ARAVE|nr:hypothetical protein AVEN_251910-1 [Araneus ventricosus]
MQLSVSLSSDNELSVSIDSDCGEEHGILGFTWASVLSELLKWVLEVAAFSLEWTISDIWLDFFFLRGRVTLQMLSAVRVETVVLDTLQKRPVMDASVCVNFSVVSIDLLSLTMTAKDGLVVG